MPQGRHTSLTMHLTSEQRQTLVAWQRSLTIRAGYARRGRIILLLADGTSITDIAKTVGMSRRFVYKWVSRFLQDGIDGLADKPGRGHRRLSLPTQRYNPNKNAPGPQTQGIGYSSPSRGRP